MPLDTSGDSFEEDNNDDYFAVCKGYLYVKKRFQLRLDSVHQMQQTLA